MKLMKLKNLDKDIEMKHLKMEQLEMQHLDVYYFEMGHLGGRSWYERSWYENLVLFLKWNILMFIILMENLGLEDHDMSCLITSWNATYWIRMSWYGRYWNAIS